MLIRLCTTSYIWTSEEAIVPFICMIQAIGMHDYLQGLHRFRSRVDCFLVMLFVDWDPSLLFVASVQHHGGIFQRVAFCKRSSKWFLHGIITSRILHTQGHVTYVTKQTTSPGECSPRYVTRASNISHDTWIWIWIPVQPDWRLLHTAEVERICTLLVIDAP